LFVVCVWNWLLCISFISCNFAVSPHSSYSILGFPTHKGYERKPLVFHH
jgi:hypothetical protein